MPVTTVCHNRLAVWTFASSMAEVVMAVLDVLVQGYVWGRCTKPAGETVSPLEEPSRILAGNECESEGAAAV